MLIGLLALYSQLLQKLASVRSMFMHAFSIVADPYSSVAVAKAAMGGDYQFDVSTSHHSNGEYVPRISVS